ncbi:MAG: phage antirepressor [Bacillota bacterium]
MRDVKIFNHKEFGELNILIINGKEYFPASRCAAILGYTNTRDAISRHCRGVVKHDIIDNLGRTQVMNFIPEGDLYRLIIRSNLPKAEQFERWVFDEVLPSIRKYGFYATDALIDDILNNPDLGIKLFTEYKQAKEKARQLELETAKQKQIIGELRPKASYYDQILQNKSLVPITKIAKDYGMSGRAFNKLLHELGVQYKMGNCWLLYQEYADQGYTQSKTHAIDAERSVMHTYWTQKGRLFIYDLLKNKKGILPVIEREQKSA